MEVIEMCLEDRNLIVWILEEMTEITKERVCKILVEDLIIKNVCARFVPQF
jgi:hypothetical protein